KKGRRSPEIVRLTQAGDLRDYYGRPACELTDTEVMCWWWASCEAWRQFRDDGKAGTKATNPDFELPK
ncbi:MAG: hypothetical protein ABIY55_29685, partial [Kofleriaceae bacterium]